MSGDLSADDIAAIARVIRLLEKGWPADRRLAESLRSWMKGEL